MSDFHEMTPQRPTMALEKNLKPLKYKHIRCHFKTHDLEIR